VPKIAALKRCFGWLLPAEWIVLGALAFAALMIASGYPVLAPRLEGGEGLQQLSSTAHYGTIVLVSIGLYMMVSLARGMLRGSFSSSAFSRDVFQFLRLLLALMIALYLMLCFKWWSHLGPQLYDGAYLRMDEAAGALKHWILSLDATLEIPHIFYFRIYAAAFVTSYALSIALAPGIFSRLVTAGAAVCVIGGASYMLAPAYGPLFFALPEGSIMEETQRIMLEVSEAFRASNGAAFDPYRFEAVLGAMPSLHVAHSVVICAFTWRMHRLLGLGYLLVALYVSVFAVATHFHYLIDLPAGLLVAVVAVKLTDWLYSLRGEETLPLAGRAHTLALKA
jgi:hypothetical protein